MWLKSPPRWSGRDHPREYGENLVWVHCIWAVGGSSPRIRGECPRMSNVKTPSWIIPANTGRMWLKSPPRWSGRDHPREYGENQGHSWLTGGTWGSSPRIRGEYPFLTTLPMPIRIIPANTGRIACAPGQPTEASDHPREYGENLRARTVYLDVWGSSPRIRGE